MSVYIKYFFVNLCSFYFFEKLLYIRSAGKQRLRSCVLTAVLTVVLAAVMYLSSQYISLLSLFITVILFCVLSAFRYRLAANVAFITGTLSFGLSYVSFGLAALVTALVNGVIGLLPLDEAYADTCLFFAAGIAQILLARIPFLFKRLKKGMPYLQEASISDTGVVIGSVLLLTTSFFMASPSKDIRFAVYLFTVTICGVLITVWWLNQLTMRYQKKRKEREREKLELQLRALQAENSALRQNNEMLSKIIHKDNKLIPAMEFSVRELLQTTRFPDAESRQKAAALLQHLQSAAQDRAGVLFHYEHQRQALPQTGVASVDSIIGYMAQRSYGAGIDFNVSFTGSVKYLIEAVISENDLVTLIADLTENAQIAVNGSDSKHILLCIGIEDDHYTLDVFDGGALFSEEVVAFLGKRRITAHAETGGSGIGMMTTFALLKKYAASFVLDETIAHPLYTKKISVCLDGLGQFRIKSRRPALLALKDVRQDIIWI